jgi:hypothetical protein
VILLGCDNIFNMNCSSNPLRCFLNCFGLIFALSLSLGDSAQAVRKKRPSIEERIRKSEETRAKQMMEKTKQHLDAQKLTPEDKKILARPIRAMTPEEEASENARLEKEAQAMRTKLTPEEEAKVKEYFAKQGKDPQKVESKSETQMRGKTGGAEGVPSKRSFRTGVGKSPTEYGNSTATPGEAEKEAIEYQGKSSKKKPKAEDADQE